jgi:hypothetical protein
MAGLALGTLVGINVNDMFEPMPVSTNEGKSIQANLMVYPNPAIDHIFIHSPDIRQGTAYTVFDITGRKWQRGVLANETTVVSIDALAPGLYFLLVDAVYPATIRFTKS